MSSTDSHSGFRLPWQAAHPAAPEADDQGSPESATATAVAEKPAWPTHDLDRPGARAVADTTDATDSPDAGKDAASGGMTTTEDATMTYTETAPATDMTPAEEAAPAVDPWTGTTTPMSASPAAASSAQPPAAAWPGSDTRTRKPTKFLADLTRAMRLAADEARESALAQFHADAAHHAEEARTACDVAADAARRRADEDISSLGEWEQREIARIRRETEEGVTARQSRLEAELGEQRARLDTEIARVDTQVAAFEAEMDAFFQRLVAEEDPSRFAAMAEQLPEPPTFEAWDAMAAAADRQPPAEALTPAEEMPPAAELATADEPAPTAELATADAPAAAGDLATAEETADDAAPADDTPMADADSGMPAMQDSDFAAAEAEAEEWEVEETPAQPAAEAAMEDAPEPAEEPVAAAEPVVEAPAAPVASGKPATQRTQVAVVGLVSVASIATFKRLLARTPGIHGVQVASGPDGEFLFTATHDTAVDMPAAVEAVQGFEVHVVDSAPGIVTAQAVDPEVL